MKSPTLPLHRSILHRIIAAILLAFAVQSLGLAGKTTALVAAEPPQEAQSQPREKWILRTDDTKLALGVSSDQKLCIYELSGPDGWNWTTVPSVLPLMDRVDVAGVRITPAWTYSERNRGQE